MDRGLDSKDESTRKKAQTAFRFREQREPVSTAIVVPNHSSERRLYLPIGLVDRNVVATNALNVIYDAPVWVFAVLTSRMHMSWLRSVGGRIKNDYRYSATIVYNNFPVPHLTAPAKEQLTEAAFRVIDAREYHSEKTLGELYDPDLMPSNLRAAHQELDELVDAVYRPRGFNSDEERLANLFDMYEQLAAQEGLK